MEAHENGSIHFHDSINAQHMHNYLAVNLDDIFKMEWLSRNNGETT